MQSMLGTGKQPRFFQTSLLFKKRKNPFNFLIVTRESFCSLLLLAELGMSSSKKAKATVGHHFEMMRYVILQRDLRMLDLGSYEAFFFFSSFFCLLLCQVNWDVVRVLEDGETVSIDGTHLGHNLPDSSGRRYCINLVSIAGREVAE